jgi:very-short-patch-repair endonuclease
MFSTHPKSNMWSERNELSPHEIPLFSNKKYEFKCHKCLHYFMASLDKVARSCSPHFCPYCNGKKLCDNCDLCYNRSFASHEKSKYWSNKNITEPRKVFKGSIKEYMFGCEVCKHEFKAALRYVTKKEKGVWCPYCANIRLCDKEDCEICYNKSFASHEMSKKWSKKNSLNPRQVFRRSRKKFLFDCDCNHEIDMMLDSIINTGKTKCCPYCSDMILCNREDCQLCYNKSFASNPKCEWWSERNKINPRMVFNGSSCKYEFKCKKCQKYFSSIIYNITKRTFLGNCALCQNKTEKILFEFIETKFPDVVYQYKPQWCESYITKKLLPFDIFIPSLNIIVEIDGSQHFRQILNWDSVEHNQSKDLYKMKLAYDEGISIIRIPHEYVFVVNNFKKYKDEILKVLIPYEKPQIIYICDDDRYSHFQKYNFETDEIPIIVPNIKFDKDQDAIII